MICKNCGTLLPDIAKFCFNCGKTVNTTSDNADEKNIENNANDIKSADIETEKQDNQADKEISITQEPKPVTDEPVVAQSETKEVSDKQEDAVQPETEEVSDKQEYSVQSETEEVSDKQEYSVQSETEDADDSQAVTEELKPQTMISGGDLLGQDKPETKIDTVEKTVENTGEEENGEEEADEEEETGGYRIMVNPDYVPPVVKEEKPLFEEHIDYQSIYQQKADKIEKIAMRVGAVAGIVAAVAGVCFIGFKLFTSHQFSSKMDTAKEQYGAGNYEEAITTLADAKQMYGADENEVVALLADIYVDMDDTDRAMEEILKVYNETGDAKLYEKYQNIKGKAGNGTSNSDENKEAVEGTKEVTEGSDEYNEILNEARKLIESGDYDGAIEKCKEAGKIDDTLESVYMVYASAYAGKSDYEMAVLILDKGINTINEKAGKSVSDEYNKLLEKYKGVEEKLDEYSQFMDKLYKAMNDAATIGNVKDAVNLMISEEFSSASSTSDVTYYTLESGFTDITNQGTIMAVYDNGYVYFGDFKDGKRDGNGILMAASKEDDNIKYNMYKGAWSNNLPEGKGTIVYVENYSSEAMSMSVTTGTFKAGYEDGKMSRSKTVAGTKWGTMEYSVNQGVPVPLKDEKGTVLTNKDGKAVLGYHYFNDKPTHLVTIVEGALYGVDGLGLSMTE